MPGKSLETSAFPSSSWLSLDLSTLLMQTRSGTLGAICFKIWLDALIFRKTISSSSLMSMNNRMRSELVISPRSEEHTSELQSRQYLVCRLLLEKKKNNYYAHHMHS